MPVTRSAESMGQHVLKRMARYAIALFLLPASAWAQTVIFNNGVPDNVDGFNVANRITANDFIVPGSTDPLHPSPGISLSSFDWWVIQSGVSPSVTSSFFWQILSDVGGLPGSTVASGTVTNAVGTYTSYGFSAFEPAYFFNVSLGNLSIASGTYWLAITDYVSNVGQAPWFWATSAQSGNQLNKLPAQSWEEAAAERDADAYFTEGAFVLYGNEGVPPPPPTTIPEPGTMILLGSGLAGLAGFRARRRKST